MPQPRKYQSDAQRQAAYRNRNEQATQELLVARGLPPMPALPNMPGTARWDAALCQIKKLAEMVQEEMGQYAQQRSETWNESERGEQHQERQQILEELIDLIDTWN